MRYCYNCQKITPGEPRYCNFCGRSYNVKLCPRGHANSRNADICSECGSRDLSTPQPRTPLWAPVVEYLLKLVPGLFLALVSVVTIAAAIEAVRENPALQFALLKLLIVLGVLWWLWSELPAWFRNAIARMLKRRREQGGGKGRH
jgi:RNA polymerase subunit RPABC4/transcription elongation factor Spt4